MARAEIAWRATVAARTTVQRMAHRVRTPQWDRRQIEQALAPDVLDSTVRAAIGRNDWTALHAALARRIGSRPSRFVLDPASAPQMRSEIASRWPAAASAARARADRILTGHYDLFGYQGLEFETSGEIDWHADPVHARRAPRTFWADVPYLDPAFGDHKIIWELNRHQHWLALGRAFWLTTDARYAQRIVRELESWMAANPPLTGINWASMLEIGFRGMSWAWGLHFLLNHEEHEHREGHESSVGKNSRGLRDHRDLRGYPWLVDMLLGLHRQLTHVEQNLSYYFSPNTHLTGEALGLYVVGAALPELAGSARWTALGRQILLTEIDRQILPDGGHAERSTHYQRYTLDFYLLALLTARRIGDGPAAARFADAAARLARFTRAMADDSGRLPLIGDDDGGMLWPVTGRECADVSDSLALAGRVLEDPSLASWETPEEVFWIAGPVGATHASPLPATDTVRRTVRPSSCAMTNTGYVIARDGDGTHAVFDAGAHGYMNAGHAHADPLALTLTLKGRPLLIDPGTSTYTMDARLRDRMRSSVSHNTLTIDAAPPAVPAGPFHWRSRADGRLHAWRHNPGFDWVEASHDGYAPLVHRRSLLRTADSGWLIVDEVLGEGAHAADAHWHFDPAWSVRQEAPGRLRAAHLQGAIAWLLSDAGEMLLAHGDVHTGLGWHAPVYGTLVPTWTARATTSGRAPWANVTWIGSGGQGPVLERLDERRGDVIAARVIDGERTSVFILQRSERERPERPEPSERSERFSEYQSDARALHYAHESGRLGALDLVDASHAVWSRQRSREASRDGWISVRASGVVSDLHLTSRGETIDLASTVPPSELRLEGDPVRLARAVRLNGRALPLSVPAGADSVVITGADWGAALTREANQATENAAAAAGLST